MWKQRIVLAGVVVGIGLLFILLPLGFSVLWAAPQGTTLYVDAASGNDANDCLSPATACATIGGAVGKASDGNTILVAAGTYIEHDISVTVDVTISGAGPELTIVDGNAIGRIFDINATTVISGMRLQNGAALGDMLFTSGGGALLTNGMVTLRNLHIVGNYAKGQGGAIFNLGTLLVEDSSVFSNTADASGGGFYNYAGNMTIVRSVIAYNTTGGLYGGGIHASGTSLVLEDAVIQENASGTAGGGMAVIMSDGTALLDRVSFVSNRSALGAALYLQKGVMTATNTTMSANVASSDHGGVYASTSSALLLMQNSTIVSNTRTSTTGTGENGVFSANGAQVSLINTLVAYNSEDNCSLVAAPISLGHNLSDDATCSFTQTGDMENVDPLLAPLADNGGFVPTHALRPGSPAIDAGSAAECASSDARGVARPYDGDGDGTATCDIGAFESRHQLAVRDTTLAEGDSGTTNAVFTVTLAPTSTVPVQVEYVTADGTAQAFADYIPVSGTLLFNPGEGQKTVMVPVVGDTIDEADEFFKLLLHTPVDADLLDSEGVGTIVDDDGFSSLSITDEMLLEGNSGTTVMVFDVDLSPVSPLTVTVEFATLNGTATAGDDFVSTNGQLVFAPGETTQQIAVTIYGDTIDEGVAETFTMQLSAPANAVLADGEGVGTIQDDDTAIILAEAGPQVLEGDSGTTTALFDVNLSIPTSFTVTVEYATRNGWGVGGAVGGEDFQPISGTLVFAPGEVQKQISVDVFGDTVQELDEEFSILYSNPDPITISPTAAYALIVNDDFYVYLPIVVR